MFINDATKGERKQVKPNEANLQVPGATEKVQLGVGTGDHAEDESVTVGSYTGQRRIVVVGRHQHAFGCSKHVAGRTTMQYNWPQRVHKVPITVKHCSWLGAGLLGIRCRIVSKCVYLRRDAHALLW